MGTEPQTMEREVSQLKGKPIELNNKQGILLILISSFILTFLVIWEAPYNRIYLLAQCLSSPTLFFLNFFPILAFMVILFALTNRSVFSMAFSVGLFLLLGGVNRFKMLLRQDPLIPGDFTLISELIATLRNFNLVFLFLIFLGLVLFIVVIVLSWRHFRDQKKHPLFRIGAIVLICAVFMALNLTAYADRKLYKTYKTNGYDVFKVREYSSKGFVYSFLVDYNEMNVEPPEGYKISTYEKLDKEAESAATGETDATAVQPHIIMIMGETFADLSISSRFNFDGYQDPLENYRRIAQDSYLSGHVVVPLFGGGTAYTEYEALTGAPSAVIDNDIAPFRYIRKNVRSFPRILEANGYETLAIHPGRSWFYNRKNVYPYMGFDEALFVEDSFDENTQTFGGYISEEATIDKVVDSFDRHLAASDNPFFLFCVTIQNHGTYADKYKASKNFNSELTFTNDETNELSNFFYGLSTVDGQLNRLATYVNGLSEPVILVYFGDHLPGFTNGASIYEKLDMGAYADSSVQRMLLGYETPFFIWENNAAKEAGSLDQTALASSHTETMNAYYLCSTLYSLLGLQGQDAYLDKLKEMKEALPVRTDYTYVNGAGVYSDTVGNEQQRLLDLLDGWTYYRMFDEKLK